jgi:hypothetical protein
MAKHCGIVSVVASGSPAKMIHAVEGAPVCEVNLSGWWLRRVAAAFRFPNPETIYVQSARQP